MTKSLLYLTVIIAILFVSCNSDPAGTYSLKPFFSLKNYFESEVKKLEKERLELTKTVTNEQLSETVTIDKINWHDELHSFMEADINKPALYSSYVTDSMVNGNKSVIHYSAKDASPAIKDIIIKLQNSVPDTIIITRVMSNSYVESIETIHYFGNGCFEINVDNKPVIGKQILFTLKGEAHPAK